MATLLISIVLYRPDHGELTRTLETFSRAIGAARLERCGLVLTDHSPSRAEEAALAEWRATLPKSCEFRYCFENANPGFGSGHNKAFERGGADYEYFLVVNPDLVPALDSLAAGLDCMSRHPELGLLAPALIEANGSLRPACFRYPNLRTLLLRALGAGAEHPRIAAYECRDWDAGAPRVSPPLISGCCMLFRRGAFERLGGFDPGYFLYFEDFDLSLRAGRLGLSAYYPGMRVRHFGGGAGRKGLRHMAYFALSAMRFFNANGWRWF